MRSCGGAAHHRARCISAPNAFPSSRTPPSRFSHCRAGNTDADSCDTERNPMKSRASIQSHPIHPMLVTLPIGLWTASLGYDLASAASQDGERLRCSADDMMLAGLLGAIAAAIPGAIDYFAVIPPESSAKKRGATHGLLNVGLTALYTANYLL